MDILVLMNHAVKRYQRGKHTVEVLRDVTLVIERGEFAAVMGPSGSGKTTLLNLITGLDRPTEGEIVVAGQRIDQLSAGALARWRASHVGFIFQFYHLLPALSAEQNVELPLLLTTLSRKQRRNNVRAALELVGLTERACHKPGELSGGQQQRVAIARALVSDPPLLACDEPTGDLDRMNADSVLDLLRRVNSERGTTIVMVTHDPLAANQASRILHVDKGQLAPALPAAMPERMARLAHAVA